MELSPHQLWCETCTRLSDTKPYALICHHYRGKTAKRSGLPYIYHINEGVFLYVRLFGWDEPSIAAFCIHPIVQSDQSFKKAVSGEIDISRLDPLVVALAMEYRHVANGYISIMATRPPEQIKTSPILQVNQMLVVDKIQNKKDFMAHMYLDAGKPSRRRTRERYKAYFDSWLSRLDVSEAVYSQLVNELGLAFSDRDGQEM